MKKYEDTPYVVVVKVKNRWSLWGSCVNSKDANVIFEKAEYTDKRLLHFGSVIRERSGDISRQHGIVLINVISKDDLLNLLSQGE